MPREPTTALPVDSMDGRALKPPGSSSGRAPNSVARGFSSSRSFVGTAVGELTDARKPFWRGRRSDMTT
jgi:hypothetical protein